MSRMTSIAAIPTVQNPRRRAGTRSTNSDAVGAWTDGSGRSSDNHSPPLTARTHLSWIDDDGSAIRPERPFRQRARHDDPAARQAANVTPRGFRPAHLNRVLALKRIGVGAVLIVGDRANRMVENQQVRHLRPIAPRDTLVVGRAWKRALNQASGERDRSRPTR